MRWMLLDDVQWSVLSFKGGCTRMSVADVPDPYFWVHADLAMFSKFTKQCFSIDFTPCRSFPRFINFQHHEDFSE